MSSALAVPFGLVEDAYVRLARLAGDMARDEIEYLGPQGSLNSTATILHHLAATDLEYLYCIQGVPVPAEPTDRTPDGRLVVLTGRGAGELLGAYRGVIDQARSYLRTFSDSDAVQ